MQSIMCGHCLICACDLCPHEAIFTEFMDLSTGVQTLQKVYLSVGYSFC